MLRKIKNAFFRYSATLLRNVEIGNNCIFSPNSRILTSNQISIGDHCFVGRDVTISTSQTGKSKIIIGNDVMIAQGVKIIGGNHEISDVSVLIRLQGEGKQGNILIHDDVWIGANAIILTGVEIGVGAVIGAGSVVTKNVRPYDVVAGNPARVIRNRNE
ncbi:acyltransferase [Vibrio gigantis]|uniref:acyltransferase n=1 Tax=Vibrio gigantis TaxID=296199 RepID=UPI001BFE29B4|nr:DapH/DapD/GlmU-related protein [Vibrio gigantis]